MADGDRLAGEAPAKSWRERIVEARARKARGERGFTDEDRERARYGETCAVGERMDGLSGHTLYIITALPGERPLADMGAEWTLGMEHSCGFTLAVIRDDPANAERFLDAIEDRALALKRESASGASHAPRVPKED